MDFWTAIKIVFRRWYVALPALLATVALTVLAFQAVPPAFQAEGSVLLIPPSRVTGQQAPTVNPFADLSSSLTVTAGVMAQIMNYDATRERMRAAGGRSDYAVTPGLAGPLLIVSATADNPAAAIQTAQVVAKGIQDELIAQQEAAGAPPESFIRTLPLLFPSKAGRLSGGRIRSAAAVGALGTATSLSIVFVIESLATGRRRNRRGVARGTPEDRTREEASTEDITTGTLSRRPATKAAREGSVDVAPPVDPPTGSPDEDPQPVEPAGTDAPGELVIRGREVARRPEP